MPDRISIDPFSSSPSKPTLSGTARINANETLRIAVNGTSFSPGDGHLRFDPVEAVWQLQLPATSRRGMYRVRALIYRDGKHVGRAEAMLRLRGGLPFGSNIFPGILVVCADGPSNPFIFAAVDTGDNEQDAPVRPGRAMATPA